MSAFRDELIAIDGVGELLGSLNTTVCLATNSHPDRVRHSLEVTGLWQFFDPHVFSATHGVAAARAAGMEVVGFCGGSHCRQGHADRLLEAGCTQVFARMGELGEFLTHLARGDHDQNIAECGSASCVYR